MLVVTESKNLVAGARGRGKLFLRRFHDLAEDELFCALPS
jgi:hypothetical protein